MEITHWTLARLRTRPQTLQALGDESELRNLGESLGRRQVVSILVSPDGTLICGHRRGDRGSRASVDDDAEQQWETDGGAVRTDN
jgi:hypothetical protein